MIDYSEKRDFPRMDMDCTLDYRVDGSDESHQGQMKNLSANGINFTCEHELAPGSQVFVTVTPTNNLTPPMSAEVTVARCDPDDNDGFLVAGQIDRIR